MKIYKRPSEKYFDSFVTEFGLLMKFISVAENKNALLQLQEDIRYKNISLEGVKLLNMCTGSNIAIVENEMGGIDVCKGIDDLKKDARMEGERKGVLSSIEKLAKNLGDLEKACLLLNTTVENYKMMKAE